MYVAGHPLLNRRCTRLPGCIRLRNDLYYVEWGVKLYSLTPSVDMQVVEAYDKLMTYDNLSLEFPSRQSKISLGKSYNKLRNS